MTRRDWLAAASAAPAILRGDTRPNILFLLTDQQTRNALSCAGNPWVKTPNMDSIARNGVRFAQAYCPYPVCSPSRGAIFTGRMPHETGVRDNAKAIRSGMPTIGEIFRAAGYQTVYGGKWHLPKSFDGMTGFEKLIGGSGQGADMDAPLADTSAAWLRGPQKQPFLMVASFMNPHDICEWIRKHPGPRAEAVPADFPTAPPNLQLDPQEPEAIQMHRNKGYDLMSQAVGIASHWGENEFRHYLHDYYRMVESVDREIGKVLAALREKGLDRNTWIVFTSDHGEGMGGHGWVQKASFYEESVGVPLIISGPGLRARVENKALVNLTDILPTLCEIAGVKPPEAMRGRSLLSAHAAPMIVSELRYGSADWEGRMLGSDRFKYVVFNNGARPEQLFDRKRDPGESVNLVSSNRSALREHRQLLKDWIAKTGDDFRF